MPCLHINFHVMLYDPDMDVVKSITSGHVRMCEKPRKENGAEL
jgi:hypothetical protein